MPHESKSKTKLCKIGNYTVQGLTLGKGNFAKVELATHDTVGYPVALKIIDTETVREDYVIRNLEREAHILTNLEHPNIVMLYEAVRSNTLYCLALEYVKGCDLGEYINSCKGRRVPENTARKLFFQLVSAVKHMHHRKVLHRDLKLENILIQTDGKVKLVDFGLSNFYDPKRALRTRCGSPEYAAPELFSNMVVYGPGVDLWSLGVVLYAMAIGVLPFRYPRNEASTLAGRRQLLLEKISKGLGSTHREQMKHLSIDCQQLLERLLEPNQNARITLRDLVNHSWINADPSLPILTAKPPPYISDQATTEALHRLSILLSMSVEDLQKKIKRKSHDRIFAMFHLLRSNLELDALKGDVEEDRTSFGSSDSLSYFRENKSVSQSNRLARDGEVSSAERSFSGSSHINAKGLSRMDMGLSKILYLDKANVSAPVIPEKQESTSSKKITQDIVRETPHPASYEERQEEGFLNFSENLAKAMEGNLGTPSLRRREFRVDVKNQREVSQQVNSSHRALRSEKSLTKLKKEFYLEDVRSQERMGYLSSDMGLLEDLQNYGPEAHEKFLKRVGSIPSDMRKLDDIKNFNPRAEEMNLKIKRKPISETETGVKALGKAELTTNKYSEKNPTKKGGPRNKEIPPAARSQLSSHEDYSHSSFSSSCASGQISPGTVKRRVGNPSKVTQYKSGSRASQRIHQDTVSSLQKKNVRGSVQRSESARITPTAQGSRTLHRSPTVNAPGAKPTVNTSKSESKRMDSKNASDFAPFASNRNKKTAASNSGVSHQFSQQKSREGSVTQRKENMRTVHGAPAAGGSANKRRSAAVTPAKASARSPIVTRAKATQGGPDANSVTPKPRAASPFPSSNRKIPSEDTPKFLPVISREDIHCNAPEGRGTTPGTKDLPFPAKPIIHKRYSPHFVPRLYKKS